MLKIYLGSASPRRKTFISNLFNDFTILHPEVDETSLPDEDALLYCKRVANKKRLSLLNDLQSESNFLLICCDTTVSYKHHILGKPKDFNHAKQMLNKLNNTNHQVISSISLTYRNNNNIDITRTEAETTNVQFKKLSETDISNYLNSIHYLDKAGSYAIQENGEKIIDCIDGSMSNVIGFPLRLFFKILIEIEIFNIFK